jgi:hypothetical protein
MQRGYSSPLFTGPRGPRAGRRSARDTRRRAASSDQRSQHHFAGIVEFQDEGLFQLSVSSELLFIAADYG